MREVAGFVPIQYSMAYALNIGFRYLRSKKRSTVSVITLVAIVGVALGVGALLAVMSITSGFQDEFRNKVLGVNAHVIVQKYGDDFSEYRTILWSIKKMAEVKGAEPFLLNEMMLAKDGRTSGVLVKGVDPNEMGSVLDLPRQIVAGSLRGLRAPGAEPPISPDDLLDPTTDAEDEDLDRYLRGLSAELGEPPVRPDAEPASPPAPLTESGEPIAVDHLPEVDVPTPEEVEAALAELERSPLPTDSAESSAFDDIPEVGQAADPSRKLPGIVVGRTLADDLDLRVGDTVKIVSPLTGLDTTIYRPSGRTPAPRDFEVIAIFQAGFQEYDTRLVYVDLYEMQSLNGKGDTVMGIEVSLHDIDLATEISTRLARDLGGPFNTTDWPYLNNNLFMALQIQKVMLSLVIAGIVIVAAFNVIATLIMMVLEKRREIAILKAMGARGGTLLGIFLVQGLTIGAIGTTIGLALGGAACLYLAKYQFPLDPKVYLIDHLPVRISPTEFLWTVFIAVVICFLSTVAPSWWAARMRPVDGLRYE